MDTGSKSPSNGLAEARLAATAAAVSGDAATLYHLVAGFMDDGFSLETVLFEILAPLQRDVGIRWQSGDYLVSEEHAATATVEAAKPETFTADSSSETA